MSKASLLATACLLAAGVLLLAGLTIPAHFRATNEAVLATAGKGSPSLLQALDRLLDERRPGPALLVLQAAEKLKLSPAAGMERQARIEVLAQSHPSEYRWGGPSEWLDRPLGKLVPVVTNSSPQVLGWLLRAEVREALLRAAAASTEPAVVALLACRELETTAIFPAPKSAAGQPMDAALLATASLVASGRMHPGLALEFERTAVAARSGKGTERLETGLLNLLVCARHLNWEQLATVTSGCPTLANLQSLATSAGTGGEHWPLLFAAVTLEGSPGSTANFLARHGTAALPDLGLAIGLGQGAVHELLRRGHRTQPPGARQALARLPLVRDLLPPTARIAQTSPRLALFARYMLWADGLFLIFLGFWFARRGALSDSQRRFQPRPDYGVLAILTLTAVVALFLVSERFILTRASLSGMAAAVAQPGFRMRLRTELPRVTNPAMNEKILGMLVIFFAIQLAMYFIGLSRLRYIRNQPVEDTVKLRLLDNEESLFDAPLYIGIGGSVLALVLRLTGFDEVSLMASYSSTLFGILFCFILKVMHVRSYRQQLILDSASNEQP